MTSGVGKNTPAGLGVPYSIVKNVIPVRLRLLTGSTHRTYWSCRYSRRRVKKISYTFLPGGLEFRLRRLVKSTQVERKWTPRR